MSKEEIQNISFKIIGFAGDAYSSFNEAIENARKFNFDESERLIKCGQEQLICAHKSQTELLVSEANNEEIPFSIIMVHAQDHLMNAVMYERIALEFIELYKQKMKWEEEIHG